MKMIAVLFMASISASGIRSAAAAGFEYPALNQYQAQAQVLLQETQAAQTAEQIQAIISHTQDLIQTGVEMIHLYGERNPNCVPQFTAFLQDLGTMENLPLAQVESKYHDGTGLPAAPRHCYFGRSEIVHPVMNVIRLKGAWSESVRQDVIADFQEVLEHLAKIQAKLGYPA